MNPRMQNTLFGEKKKCIINADLDGMLSGIILHNVLGWEIVGFSMCNGKPSDELWLPEEMDFEEAMSECVFVDLPVVVDAATVIDQHFNAFDAESVNTFKGDNKKINPNVLRSMNYASADYGYTRKYPFGTVHFVIAALEKYGNVMNANIDKNMGDFTSFDVLLRADRVIGNAATYTPNCKDWANYLASDNSGQVTSRVKDAVFSDHLNQYCSRERKVEEWLRNLGCARNDGDCSNLLSANRFDKVTEIMTQLALMLDLNTPTIPNNLQRSNRLIGERYPLSQTNYSSVKRLLVNDPNVFSYAIVNTRELSVTRIKDNFML